MHHKHVRAPHDVTVPAGALAIEIDALFDGVELFVCTVGESLDSYGTCDQPWPDTGIAQPAFSLGTNALARLRDRGRALARRLAVRGPLRLRFALHNETVLPLSVVPGVGPGLACAATLTGLPLRAAAAAVTEGVSIARLRTGGVLPSTEPPGDDPTTVVRIGEQCCAIGIADSVGEAYALARIAAGDPLPVRGHVLVSLRGRELRAGLLPLRRLVELGFRLLVEPEHAVAVRRSGLDCARPAGEPVVLRARSAAGTAVAVQGIDATRHG